MTEPSSPTPQAEIGAVAPAEQPQRREILTWALADWRHAISEEGNLFRWIAAYEGKDADPDKPLIVDLGLVPGGIYVAVRKLVERQPAESAPAKNLN